MENRINIGELDTRISVLRYTETRGAESELKKTWVEHSAPYAKVERETSEQISMGNLEERQVLTVTMYKILELTTRWRIAVAGQPYEISDIDPISRISPLCVLTVHAIDR
jgi:head-tail adaptor